ncbi:hypothetical protein Bbelb_040410 [Branchiostoma belcheri]|nr:hypothetical protein Bbelb_040410 [Branchiostoma belcheri]
MRAPRERHERRDLGDGKEPRRVGSCVVAAECATGNLEVPGSSPDMPPIFCPWEGTLHDLPHLTQVPHPRTKPRLIIRHVVTTLKTCHTSRTTSKQGTRSVACQDSSSGPLGSESSTLLLHHTTPPL